MDTEDNTTWHKLQELLRNCETEEDVQKLMDAERAGPCRIRWIIRIRGRFNSLRKNRENEELSSEMEK